MRHWLKTTLRLLVLGGTTVFIVTCGDSSAPFDIGSPLFEVVDGTQMGGNEDVFFLPPLVSNPVGHPYFGDRPLNPDLEGAVFARICETDGTSCVDGPPPWVAELPMTLNGNHYQTVWSAKGLPANVDYRINIFIGNLNIAHRDVDLGKGGSCTIDDDVCTVKDNVPIKVRIESFAACIASDPTFDPDEPEATCATAFLGPDDYLALPNHMEETIGVASVETGSAAINMQTCPDLRDRDARASIDDGLIDLPTFGECVVIDALEDDADVYGTATLCNAFQAGLDAGLSEEQMGRATVHRFSTDADIEGTYALPHAEYPDACEYPSSMQGRVLNEFTGAEQFAMLLRRTWWTIQDRVRDWVEPSPLQASAPLPCHRGGCSSSGGFRSHYEAAQSAGIDHYPDPIGKDGPYPPRDLGDHLIGDVVDDVMVQAWDSGECDVDDTDCVPAPETVRNVRLTVSVVGNALVRDTSATGSFAASAEIVTGSDGIAPFDILVGSGVSTIYVGGIGVDLGKGNVQAPPLDGEDEFGPLTEEALEFTVAGFEYTIQQPGGDVIGVEPLVGTESVEDFYDYDNTDEGIDRGSSSHTVPALELSDTSIIFLYQEGEGGPVSLVMIHDDARDGSGGKAVFEFQDVPEEADFLVQDGEGGEGTTEGILPISTWEWLNCCTDGGALGYLSGSFGMMITASFPAKTGPDAGHIDGWVFLTGALSGPVQKPLDKEKPLIINGAGSP